jgi:hypothetical protein
MAHRGDPTPLGFVSESRLGGFLHAPLCGLAFSHLSSPDRDYPGSSIQSTWTEFARRGGGGISPYLVIREALALANSHLRTVTQAPLRS